MAGPIKKKYKNFSLQSFIYLYALYAPNLSIVYNNAITMFKNEYDGASFLHNT